MLRKQSLADLSQRDEYGNMRCIIETPKGSGIKYRYNAQFDCLEVAKVLPIGMLFPFDFGFFPSTLAEDGDPLDVAVLIDRPCVAGCLLAVKIIGAIEARQKSEERWIRNDRIFAVSLRSPTYGQVGSIHDLPRRWLDDVRAFFLNYAQLTGRELEIIGEHGASKTNDLIDKAITAHKSKHNSN